MKISSWSDSLQQFVTWLDRALMLAEGLAADADDESLS